MLGFLKGHSALCYGAWCRGSRGNAHQGRSTASCCSLTSDIPLGSLSSTVTSMMCHIAINKPGFPAEVSSMAQHGAVMPFPAFRPRVESAFDMVLPGMVLDVPLSSSLVM